MEGKEKEDAEVPKDGEGEEHQTDRTDVLIDVLEMKLERPDQDGLNREDKILKAVGRRMRRGCRE